MRVRVRMTVAGEGERKGECEGKGELREAFEAARGTNLWGG